VKDVVAVTVLQSCVCAVRPMKNEHVDKAAGRVQGRGTMLSAVLVLSRSLLSGVELCLIPMSVIFSV
jgi:hypothetical protein